MVLKREHYYLFGAIELWLSTLLELCDEHYYVFSQTNDYFYFVSNVLSDNNPEKESQIQQVIDDFYDYFYIKQHICDINDMCTFGELDNNYGIYDRNLRLLDALQKIETNEKNKCIFQKITIYVFHLCCSLRKELGLRVFEDPEKDKFVAQFFTRMPSLP